MKTINPWGSEQYKDYDRLCNEFGIQKIKPPKELLDNVYFRRGIVFGHRDFDKFINAFAKGENVSVLTGLMPSGPMHLGHKMVVDQVVNYQNLGIKCRVVIADIEARTTRNISKEEAQKNAIEEYLVNYVALGLDLNKSEVYSQTNRSVPYYSFGDLLSGRITMNELRSTYGDLTPGKIVSSFVQMSDILHPQLPEYDGPHHVLVPAGVDQHPHILLARGFAEKEGLIKPSSTYHRFMSGLEGGKMSSSQPSSYLGLNDSTEEAVKKAGSAITGGKPTLEEQKREGAEPDKCSVYEMYTYHFMLDDKELSDLRQKCENGEIMCGECKQILKERVQKFMGDLEKKREKARKTVNSLELF